MARRCFPLLCTTSRATIPAPFYAPPSSRLQTLPAAPQPALSPSAAFEKRRHLILQRLYDEEGIGPQDRLDAYVLGRATALYPPWVFDLPKEELTSLLSATDLGADAEIAKKALSSFAPKKRITEWRRMCAAKKYADGLQEEDERVSFLQRDLNQNDFRQYAATLRNRSKKISARRREMLGKPTQVIAVPSKKVDYSRRLAMAASKISQGEHTNGHWPLRYEKRKKWNS